MIDDSDAPSNPPKPVSLGKLTRIEKADRARERGAFDPEFPKEVGMVLADIDKREKVSEALHGLGIGLPANLEASFVSNVLISLFKYSKARELASTRSKEKLEAVQQLKNDIDQLIKTLSSIAKNSDLRHPLDTFVSELISSFWIARNKEIRASQNANVSTNEELSGFTLLYDHMASTDKIVVFLSNMQIQLHGLSEIFRKGSNIDYALYNLVSDLAETWHFYFDTKPTQSRNNYERTTARRKSNPNPSRLFEKFTRQVATEAEIGDDIFRSVLEKLALKLGETRRARAARDPERARGTTH